MAELKNLLVATDFSSSARHAAERAALIASESGACLDLLHVLNLAALQELQQFAGDIPEGVTEEAVSRGVQAEMETLAESLRAFDERERLRSVAREASAERGRRLI